METKNNLIADERLIKESRDFQKRIKEMGYGPHDYCALMLTEAMGLFMANKVKKEKAKEMILAVIDKIYDHEEVFPSTTVEI